MIKIVNSISREEWTRFVLNNSDATIYHTPEWKEVLERTFGFKPYYVFAKENGEITGMLPLFYIKSIITGNRLCLLPFSHFCGPIGDKKVLKSLIKEEVSLHKDLNVNYLEIRDYIDFDGFESQNTFSTYILELSPNIEEVWKRLDKRSVMWAIKKSKKNNVIVEKTRNVDDFRKFYKLNCATKREIGVPSHPWSFFKNLFKFLNDNISLYVARYNGEIIAGGIMESFKDTVIYGYGAANSDYLELCPYNAFIWKSIEDACQNGYRYFDFGRTSYDNTGLISFKKRWGTAEKKLYYSYYPRVPESLIGSRDSLAYKLGTKVIRKMPMSIYKKFSDVMFRNFG